MMFDIQTNDIFKELLDRELRCGYALDTMRNRFMRGDPHTRCVQITNDADYSLVYPHLRSNRALLTLATYTQGDFYKGRPVFIHRGKGFEVFESVDEQDPVIHIKAAVGHAARKVGVEAPRWDKPGSIRRFMLFAAAHTQGFDLYTRKRIESGDAPEFITHPCLFDERRWSEVLGEAEVSSGIWEFTDYCGIRNCVVALVE